MIIDPDSISVRDMYLHMVSAITPRPIAWVSTCSPEGKLNLAPFSFFNGVGAKPPTVVFSPVNNRDGSKKDTLINVEAVGEFVVNMVSCDVAESMNETSAEYLYEVDEFEACGLTPESSHRVKPPRVKEARIQFECTVHDIIRVGDGPLGANMVIGRIVLMHADDAVLNEDGQIMADKLDNVGRMGGSSYTTTRDRFELPRPPRPS